MNCSSKHTFVFYICPSEMFHRVIVLPAGGAFSESGGAGVHQDHDTELHQKRQQVQVSGLLQAMSYCLWLI